MCVDVDVYSAAIYEHACCRQTGKWTHSHLIHRSFTYETRLFKYAKRGFSVLLTDFDRDRVNPMIIDGDRYDEWNLHAKLHVYGCKLIVDNIWRIMHARLCQ